MSYQQKSPEIISIQWGKVRTNDDTFKDAKLFPGGSREWDWTETGTRHTPGIQPEDVKELLEHGAKVLILSTGINQRLNICSETEHFLNHKNIPYYTLQTEKAVCKYNELRKYEAVAILIHSTC